MSTHVMRLSSPHRDVPRYRVTLSLSVADVGALWSAAAERALATPGATLADVIETLGPREDPSVADCIAMLAMPGAIGGCVAEDFAVVEEVAPAAEAAPEAPEAPEAPDQPGIVRSA